MQRVRTGTPTSSAALVAALLVSLLALLATGAPAARADAAQVTVVSPGGSQQTLSLAALAGSEDVVDRGYVLRGSGGETSQTVTGFSLAALIEAAGADPFTFSFLEVQRPSGGAVLLSRHQALDGGAFADGPPVLHATATGTGFLRPSADASDLNADDSFDSPQGIAVVLRKGTPLQVKVEASTRQTKPGKKVTFSAVVEQSGAGQKLTYEWDFGDGHSGSGAEATHSFAKPGNFEVVLGVTAPGDEAGSSAVVRIQVGAPIGGPDRQGGGRNEDKAAPDNGAAAGPTTGTGSGVPSGLPAAPVAGAEASPAPPAEAPAPAPAPVEEAAPEPAGEEVSGELLAAPTSAEREPEQARAEARRGSLDGDGGSGGGLSAEAWGGLATLGLLGLGGLLEARGAGGLLPGRRGGLA